MHLVCQIQALDYKTHDGNYLPRAWELSCRPIFFSCCRRLGCCNTWGCVSQHNIWLVTNLVRNVLAHSFIKACERISSVTCYILLRVSTYSWIKQLSSFETNVMIFLPWVCFFFFFFLLAEEMLHMLRVYLLKCIWCLNSFSAYIPKCCSQNLTHNEILLSSYTSFLHWWK